MKTLKERTFYCLHEIVATDTSFSDVPVIDDGILGPWSWWQYHASTLLWMHQPYHCCFPYEK
jgi:hypothetical protein